MRSVSVLFILLAFSVQGQLINGSFEQDLSGWVSPQPCANPTASPEVPGGTGDWSLRLNAQSHAPVGCIYTSDSVALYQPLPWITPGTWTLSGWIKGVDPNTLDGNQVIVAYDPFTFFGSIGWIDSTWHFSQSTVTIPTGFPTENIRLVILPAGLSEYGPYYAYFDDLSLDITTSVTQPSAERPAFRPNPATDRLWVDLADLPSQIVLLDAIGRRVHMGPYTVTGRTLEADVSAAPTGLCSLLIFTAKGVSVVHFVKV
ncbi:MAG: hypothetical protein IPI00_02780 [Flavobacteriales bacterium]|nr:hypothetical protein [Flavobacteriales bacterium]MBK6945956.1 hypothetical protein [Flavobacteriales bacterium]MBK7239106.1 hypothetical protein [Flavobacteriales bacterium]MBK7296712.1 hypothetical protein [Flavobacteriales bacterium]MBK9536789.1 hypothetical protein [Flavobacteriales bacterium]